MIIQLAFLSSYLGMNCDPMKDGMMKCCRGQELSPREDRSPFRFRLRLITAGGTFVLIFDPIHLRERLTKPESRRMPPPR